MGQTLSDKVAACEIDESFARGGQGFIVFAESAVVAEPGEGALNDPASSL